MLDSMTAIQESEEIHSVNHAWSRVANGVVYMDENPPKW